MSAIGRYVQEKFQEWRAARTQKETRWLEYYRMYGCIPDTRDSSRKSERSQIKTPAIKEAVTNFVYSAMQLLFPTDPWFSLPPNSPQARQSGRPEVVRDFLRYLFSKENNVEKHRLALTELGLYGTLTSRVRPCKKTHMRVKRLQVPKIDPLTGTPLFQMNPDGSPVLDPMGQPVPQIEEQITREETDYVYPLFDPLSIFNVYTNPTATGPQRGECEGIIHRTMLSRSQLELLREEGTISRLPSEDSKPEGDRGSQLDVSDTLYQRLNLSGVTAHRETDQYELIEWHGYIPANILQKQADEDAAKQASDANSAPPAPVDDTSVVLGTGTPINIPALNPASPSVTDAPKITEGKEMVLYVVDGEVLNDDTEPQLWFGERPFMVTWFERKMGEFYGYGIADAAYGPQKALDATVRARIDNLALSLNVMGAVNRNKLAPGENLDMYPGKLLQVTTDPREVLSFLQIPDVTGSTYPAAQEYERMIQSAHGVKPVIGGQSSKRGEQTATEVSSLMSQAMGLIKQIAESYENNVLEPMLRWYVRILFQFPNPEEQFVVLGPNGQMAMQSIESIDVPADLEFIPMGAIQTEMFAQQTKILNVLQATANPLDAPWVNRPLLIQRLFESLGFQDARELVIAPPVHPMIQSMMQAQMMQGGPGAGSTPGEQTSEQPGAMLGSPASPGAVPQPIA